MLIPASCLFANKKTRPHIQKVLHTGTRKNPRGATLIERKKMRSSQASLTQSQTHRFERRAGRVSLPAKPDAGASQPRAPSLYTVLRYCSLLNAFRGIFTCWAKNGSLLRVYDIAPIQVPAFQGMDQGFRRGDIGRNGDVMHIAQPQQAGFVRLARVDMDRIAEI